MFTVTAERTAVAGMVKVTAASVCNCGADIVSEQTAQGDTARVAVTVVCPVCGRVHAAAGTVAVGGEFVGFVAVSGGR